MIRVGLGYDIHRLISGRSLILGGIILPFEKGEDGHSDGDVLFHAITDAILGASGLGDIGSFFPPEDPQWKDADSALLLKTVMEKVYAAGWMIENLDCIIKLEKPKFIPYRQQVIKSIADTLNISPDKVFVKAKTGEKLPPVGTSEAVEAQAVCLLSKAQD
jgi:2-C-methyl-D-erythritol 2,4-cyclodiphosphate synthase